MESLDGMQDKRVSQRRREAFELAARSFTDLVTKIGAADWDAPGLGEWTVRDLVGHASRSFITIESYLSPLDSGQPTGAVDLAGPADYYLEARAILADPAAVTERGRAAGSALGADPAQAIRELAARVLSLVDATPDDTPVRSIVGTITLVDYLPTRTFELTVHSLDLARALPPGTVPADATPTSPALTAALELAAELAARGPDAADLLLLLTGRGSSRPGLSVV